MNRRQVLRATGASVAAVSSGCLGLLASDDAYDPVAKWAVGATADVSLEGYELGASDLSVVEEAGAEPRSVELAVGEVTPETVESMITVEPADEMEIPPYVVLRCDWEEAEMASRIEEHTDRESESYEGFRIYPDVQEEEGSWTDNVYAIQDGLVVGVGGGMLGTTSTPEHARRVVDAADGSAERLTEQHEGAATVASRIDPGSTSGITVTDPDAETDLSRNQIAGVEATGATTEIADGTSDVTAVLAYRSADDVDRDVLDEYVDVLRRERDAADVSYRVDGAVATVDWRRDVES